ncbi:MAG: hypothetical protein ACPGYY_00720 [Bacteroidia bacterium]
MWTYIYFVGVLTIAFLIGRNSKNNGYGFWRSFIFITLLGAMVLAFLVKQFNGG